MNYIVPSWKLPSLAVVGLNERFPVRRIYCVGRNYAEHAREMGQDPNREPPFFFMKPADAIAAHGTKVPYPTATANLHHEVELVAAIAKDGVEIPTAAANDHIYGYAVGLDLTRRDLQQISKDRRWPWDTGKSFDFSAPCGDIAPAARIGHPTAGAITLDIDGERRQSGDLADMIWSIPEIVGHLSRLFTLRAGDLIYTGTPAGVGPVLPGQRLECLIAGVGKLSVTVGGSE